MYLKLSSKHHQQHMTQNQFEAESNYFEFYVFLLDWLSGQG